jgi:hypothetical protein
MSEPRYYLSNHAFICVTHHHTIILDSRRDRYFAVPRHSMESLGPSLYGWCDHFSSDCRAISHPDESSSVADQLVDLGILTTDASRARHVRPDEFPTAEVDLLPDTPNPSVGLCGTTRHLIPILRACRRADYQLRHQTLETVLAGVRKRRLQARPGPESCSTEALTEAKYLCRAFRSVLIYYPRAPLCLFSSLALLHFLANHGLYPEWIFGVQPDPLLAHCWIQSGSTVLIDSIDIVNSYRPIMRV